MVRRECAQRLPASEGSSRGNRVRVFQLCQCSTPAGVGRIVTRWLTTSSLTRESAQRLPASEGSSLHDRGNDSAQEGVLNACRRRKDRPTKISVSTGSGLSAQRLPASEGSSHLRARRATPTLPGRNACRRRKDRHVDCAGWASTT